MTRECHVRFCESAGVRSPRATHLVLGCQHEADGKKLLVALKDRLAHFGLSLHEGKTRLIAFGRFAAQRRQAAGLRRPETSWASRTIAARPGAAGSWSNARRRRNAWSGN